MGNFRLSLTALQYCQDFNTVHALVGDGGHPAQADLVGDAGHPAQADQQSVAAVRRCCGTVVMLLVMQGVVV